MRPFDLEDGKVGNRFHSSVPAGFNWIGSAKDLTKRQVKTDIWRLYIVYIPSSDVAIHLPFGLYSIYLGRKLESNVSNATAKSRLNLNWVSG